MLKINKKSIHVDSIGISNKTNLILNILLAAIAIASIYPLLLVIAVSITDETTLNINGYHLIPQKLSFYAYQYALTDFKDILRAYGATILVTIVGSILSVITVILYAYPLSRVNFKFKRIFSFIIYFTMLFNGGLVPWYMVYVKVLHLKNSYWALIIPLLISPWYVMIARTFFKTSIPESLIDAAKIDGSGEFYTFVKIVVPLAKPVVATIFLFSVLGYWNDWYQPMMFITDDKKITIQYLLYRIENNIQYLMTAANSTGISFTESSDALAKLPNQSIRMALAIIAIGPIVFAYPFVQKYFVKGLTIGAVKG